MMMDPVYGRASVMAAAAVIGIIRAAHSRSRHAGKVETRRGAPAEAAALAIAFIGFVIPIVWALRSRFAFANYSLHVVPFAAGVLVLIAALWLFDRTHRDLGRNWSARLQILESHQLITQGVYRHVRHPMYLSLLLYGLGQAMVAPNWIAGSACLAGNAILFALRVGPEERMMRERFGPEYDAYVARTARLIPGMW